MWAAVGAVPTSIIGIVMEIIQMHPDLLTPSLLGNIFRFQQTVSGWCWMLGFWTIISVSKELNFILHHISTLMCWIDVLMSVQSSPFDIQFRIKSVMMIGNKENYFHAIWKFNLRWVPLCQIIDRSGLCLSPASNL